MYFASIITLQKSRISSLSPFCSVMDTRMGTLIRPQFQDGYGCSFRIALCVFSPPTAHDPGQHGGRSRQGPRTYFLYPRLLGSKATQKLASPFPAFVPLNTHTNSFMLDAAVRRRWLSRRKDRARTPQRERKKPPRRLRQKAQN